MDDFDLKEEIGIAAVTATVIEGVCIVLFCGMVLVWSKIIEHSREPAPLRHVERAVTAR